MLGRTRKGITRQHQGRAERTSLIVASALSAAAIACGIGAVTTVQASVPREPVTFTLQTDRVDRAAWAAELAAKPVLATSPLTIDIRDGKLPPYSEREAPGTGRDAVTFFLGSSDTGSDGGLYVGSRASEESRLVPSDAVYRQGLAVGQRERALRDSIAASTRPRLSARGPLAAWVIAGTASAGGALAAWAWVVGARRRRVASPALVAEAQLAWAREAAVAQRTGGALLGAQPAASVAADPGAGVGSSPTAARRRRDDAGDLEHSIAPGRIDLRLAATGRKLLTAAKARAAEGERGGWIATAGLARAAGLLLTWPLEEPRESTAAEHRRALASLAAAELLEAALTRFDGLRRGVIARTATDPAETPGEDSFASLQGSGTPEVSETELTERGRALLVLARSNEAGLSASLLRWCAAAAPALGVTGEAASAGTPETTGDPDAAGLAALGRLVAACPPAPDARQPVPGRSRSRLIRVGVVAAATVLLAGAAASLYRPTMLLAYRAQATGDARISIDIQGTLPQDQATSLQQAVDRLRGAHPGTLHLVVLTPADLGPDVTLPPVRGGRLALPTANLDALARTHLPAREDLGENAAALVLALNETSYVPLRLAYGGHTTRGTTFPAAFLSTASQREVQDAAALRFDLREIARNQLDQDDASLGRDLLLAFSDVTLPASLAVLGAATGLALSTWVLVLIPSAPAGRRPAKVGRAERRRVLAAAEAVGESSGGAPGAASGEAPGAASDETGGAPSREAAAALGARVLRSTGAQPAASAWFDAETARLALLTAPGGEVKP